MSSSGSVTSGGDLDALEEWATTIIANVERELGAAMAEKDRKIRDLENSNVMLKERCKELDEQNERIKELESEEAMRKLKGKLVRLENELVTQRKEIREVSEANVQWKTALKKLSEEREEEVGEIQREVERLQRLLIDVEEENEGMKNAIKTLEEEKKAQFS